MPPHQLETQKYQPCVKYICLAVIADTLQIACLKLIKYLAATHAHLAREAQQGGNLVQRCICPGIIQGQHIHQIKMASMVTAQVVVIAKAAVILAGFPVARRTDTMAQGAVMQYRQIKPATVPTNQLR